MTAKKDTTEKSSAKKPAAATSQGATPQGATPKLKQETIESLTEQSTPAGRKSSLRGWLIVGLVVAAFVGGLAVWPKYADVLEGYLPADWLPGAGRAEQRSDEIADALDALVARLADAEKRIAELTDRPIMPDGVIDQLKGQMTATEQRLDELSAASIAAVTALAEKVGRVVMAQSETPPVSDTPADTPTDTSVVTLPADLDARLAALEAAPREVGVSGDIVDKLNETLEQVHAANLELQARLATAEARLTAIADAEGGGDNAAVLVAASGQLRARIERGGSFAADLAAVKSLLSDPGVSQALDNIQPHAAGGVESVAALARSFSLIAAGLAKSTDADTADWLAGAWARMAALVSVRRTGEIAGEGNEARVARAETRLAQGDLAAAVAEASSLTPASLERAAGWLAAARARLAVEDALDQLARHAVQQMAQERKSP